ncbi:hypothetical protein [Massilia sp. Se16.2.3]|uniref:hypothetical protein n=1 Tax=Massilia sp. Se16.2.3 TaxID=2709303 RepID=UPI001E2BDC3C|nr:hypothetical protein [Massilia sp. Se16.2.3]
MAAGVTMSYVELSGRALATTRVRRAVVWDTVQFALNGVMFVLLGEQLPEIVGRTLADSRLDTGATPLQLAGTALAIALALTLLRLVWVWVSLRLTLRHARRQGQEVYKPGFRLVLATSLAGVRGAITMAGVLTLPLTLPGGAPFPGRDLAIFYASSVIILSLLAASVALPRLLRGLEVPEESGEEAAEDHARHAAAVAAIAAVDKAAHARIEDELDIDADVHASAVDHVRAASTSIDSAARVPTTLRVRAWPSRPSAITGWRRCRPSAARSRHWCMRAACRTRRRASCCAKSTWSRHATGSEGGRGRPRLQRLPTASAL